MAGSQEEQSVKEEGFCLEDTLRGNRQIWGDSVWSRRLRGAQEVWQGEVRGGGMEHQPRTLCGCPTDLKWEQGSEALV
jgi:hypothetical protein